MRGLNSTIFACLILQSCGGGSKKHSVSNFDEEETTVTSDAVAQSYYDGISQEVLNACDDTFPAVEAITSEVKDQHVTGMCSAVSGLRMLEDNQLKRGNLSERLSLLHFASLTNDNNAVPMWSAASMMSAFEKIQVSNTLRLASDLPFDEKIHSMKTAELFRTYYDGGGEFSVLRGNIYDVNISSDDLLKWKQNSVSAIDFSKNVFIPLSSFQKRTPSPIKYAKIKPFNYRMDIFRPQVASKAFAHIFRTLKSNKILGAVTCGNRLPLIEGTEYADEDPTKCGLHMVNILSARKKNNKCELLIGNSTGAWWGENGNLWMDLKTFLRIMIHYKPEQMSMVYTLTLMNRNESAPPVNESYGKTPDEHYVGSLKDSEYHGRGKIVKIEGDITYYVEGIFHEGTLIDGTTIEKHKNGKVVKTTYKDGNAI